MRKGDDALNVLASKTDSDFSRGAALNTLGLANTIVYHTFIGSYTRTINPNLSVTGQLGLVGGHQRVHFGIAQDAPANIYAVGRMDDHAEGEAGGVRQPDRRAPRRRLSPTLRRPIRRA